MTEFPGESCAHPPSPETPAPSLKPWSAPKVEEIDHTDTAVGIDHLFSEAGDGPSVG